ncbi:hypothetical protein E6C60_3081 [Paenibacillus algicola]|uniref:Lipoprotein n=1 Tax=Paenibacillus algicola TaxID=2565926 RepID=A0A4P8XLY8_9BACL|nr:hypothetical protein [Paenibacillus algicola]QCT03792.1 hypothetical protein E6C60_3081 [Paenibacillus algicola]
MKPFMKLSVALFLAVIVTTACSDTPETKEPTSTNIVSNVNNESKNEAESEPDEKKTDEESESNQKPDVEEEKPKEPVKQPAKEPVKEPVKEKSNDNAWEVDLKKIASEDSSKTEKADAAEMLARAYKPSDAELDDFQKYIVYEFKNNRYLADSDNDGYMLGNIFRSVVLNRSLQESHPASQFAYDFYQNSKYVYRGAETPESESVKSNEEQMNDNMRKIK